MSSKIALGLDTNHNVTYELPLSNDMYNFEITANNAKTITIPPNCTRVFFSFTNGSDVWVDYSVTATFPSAGFNQGTKELNPVARYGLTPGNTLSFISNTNSYVGLTFFSDNINGY